MDEPQFVEPVFEPTAAHQFDENPEDHIGVELPDPWDHPNIDEGWRQNSEAPGE